MTALNLKANISARYKPFLDDVLKAGKRGLRGHLLWVPAGRARSAGILTHPREVFGVRIRVRYARARSVCTSTSRKGSPSWSLPLTEILSARAGQFATMMPEARVRSWLLWPR